MKTFDIIKKPLLSEKTYADIHNKKYAFLFGLRHVSLRYRSTPIDLNLNYSGNFVDFIILFE